MGTLCTFYLVFMNLKLLFKIKFINLKIMVKCNIYIDYPHRKGTYLKLIEIHCNCSTAASDHNIYICIKTCY